VAPRGGVAASQPGIAPPEEPLPRVVTDTAAAVWWVGVHGGAGESTLELLAPGTRAASHSWPLPGPGRASHRVVLVARTHYAGLVAAQRAATDWATGSLGDGVVLEGLVLISDAPGRLPKPLADLEQIIAGGVPRTWRVPFVSSWRTGPVAATPRPLWGVRRLLADLSLVPLVSSDVP
jgi:hypothetical protein